LGAYLGIKTFHDKQKLKQFIMTKPALKKILKEFYTQKRKIIQP
jgi:hypothetical protein